MDFTAENAEDFSPWGRPGAGAPVKDREGNILADFNQRKVAFQCSMV